MKQYNYFTIMLSATIIGSSFFVPVFLPAQSVSYNLNSIPITGSFNTAIGTGTLNLNAGDSNTAIGYYSLSTNSTGRDNTGMGYRTLFANLSGRGNSGFGSNALATNSTGIFNTAVGYHAMHSNISGQGNTANGTEALASNRNGDLNTAVGMGSLFANTTGWANTALGYSTLSANSTGSYNTVAGLYASINNISGGSNASYGYGSSYYNQTGNDNTGIGTSALYNNIIGSNNTALGESAGHNALGSGNIFLGNYAGYNDTGSYKFYLGSSADKTLMYGNLTTGQLLMGMNVIQNDGYQFNGTRTLNIAGGILTDSVRIAPVGAWADYVFQNDYKLSSLADLEKYISKNKRLPDVPSDQEVAVKGIELGSMQATLLKKIEELTLYVLQLQKQIDELKVIIKPVVVHK